MSPRRSLSKKSTVTVVHPKSGRSMDLSGEELDEFCRGHGLCRRCARVITHKRVFKLFGTNHPKWEPLTVLKPTTAADEWNNNGDNKGGNQGGNHGNVEQYKKNDEIDNDEDDSYLVYKGYCLGEGCYTMKEARRLLGETGDKNSRYNKENSGWRSRMTKSTRFKKKNPKRPGKRRTRTNPETGSVVTNAASLSSLRSSSSSSIVTTSSASTRHSIISGMSGLSGFSGMSGSVKSTRRSGRSRRSTQRSSSRSSSDDDDDEHNRKEFSSEKNAVSHIVVERLEKLVSYDYFTVLDLSNIDMSNSSKSTKNESNANLDALVKAIGIAKTLKAVVLEKCGLGDEGLEKLAGGLEQQIVTTSLHKSKSADAGDVLLPSILRLRGNRIGNRGVQALEFLFRSSSTLKEVDLSDNHIGSKGACSLFESLAQNPNGIPLSVLNLSQNEIWELSSPMENNNASTFLYTNSTLKELNLDGNLLHDGGAEFIAQSIRSNRRCALKRLHLGWNAIGDDGVRALGKALESNTSLEVLGLAENDITNTGARALLAALAVNTSVKEISGLYHNPIERKFIIVAIKRLLHRKSSVRGDKNNTDPARSLANSEHSAAAAASTRTGATTAADNEDYEDSEEMIVPLKPAASNKAVVVVDDGFSRLQRSYEETARSSQGGDHHTHASTASHSGGSLALEAIENWDWGTFGIEEIERKISGDLDDNIEVQVDGYTDPSSAKDSALSNSNTKRGLSADTKKLVDRMFVFQSAPLAYFDRKKMQHVGVPLLDFDLEARSLRDVLPEDKNIDVVFQNATQNNFKLYFSKSLSPVMHFSCHGNDSDCLILENGFGYMQALPLDSLKKMVAASKIKLVVVSSCNSRHLGEVFLNAGVPHVVALQRETTYSDEGPIDFARAFYGALGQRKTLREAFDIGINECKKFSKPPRLLDAYKLLPEHCSNHDVEIFFQQSPPPITESVLAKDLSEDTSILPEVPKQFVGREVDLYEILESLRVDDVVRVGGAPGSGKKSILAVLSRYILERSRSLEIDSVYWFPTPPGVTPDPDSLYGDLCNVMKWIVEAEDDVWDEEDYAESRERIVIEMEGKNSILVIDGRIFANEIAGEMLERFLTHILNEVNVKILLITATDESRVKSKRSKSEEATIHLGPLDYTSTVRVFGSACPLLSLNEKDCSCTVDTVEEFESCLLPNSKAAGPTVFVDPKQDVVRSPHQSELYNLMGSGNPRDIARKAASCQQEDLYRLLRLAQRPVVSVASSTELERQVAKWVARKEQAVQNHYYLRASDIDKTLQELEDLRKTYPSLTDMKTKERDLKEKFRALLKAKRYDEANSVKRQLLTLKRSMVKEQSSSSSISSQSTAAQESILEIQERMKTMIALAETLGQSMSSVGSPTSHLVQESPPAEAEFCLSDTCTLKISPGCLWTDFPCSKTGGTSGKDNSTVSAMIVFTNEACDLTSNSKAISESGDTDRKLKLSEKIHDLETLTETQWGTVKCATGESVALDDIGAGGNRNLCIVLAVPPLVTNVNEDAKDFDSDQHYVATQLRSAIRSSFRTVRRTNNKVTAIGISTSPSLSLNGKGNRYRTNDELDSDENTSSFVTLKAIVDEICRGGGGKNNECLRTVHLFPSTGIVESKMLIRTAFEMGLKCR